MPGAAYPTIRHDAEGDPVLVVNSDQLYSYVGNLMITFDDAGRIMMATPTQRPSRLHRGSDGCIGRSAGPGCGAHCGGG